MEDKKGVEWKIVEREKEGGLGVGLKKSQRKKLPARLTYEGGRPLRQKGERKKEQSQREKRRTGYQRKENHS